MSRRADRVLAVLGALGLAGSIAVLLPDRGAGVLDVHDATAPIGRIAFVLPGARKRSAAEMGWRPLEAAEAAYAGDTIFVPDDSAVSIVLRDGATIDVDEASQIDIGDRSVRLHRGSLVGQAARRSMRFTTAIGGVDLEGGAAVHFVGRDDGAAEIHALRGALTVEAGRATERLEVGERSGFDVAGVLLPKQVATVALTRPVRHDRLYAKQWPHAIAFEWANPRPRPTSVQVARDIAFTSLVYESALGPAHATKFDSANEGTYFWRVVDDEGQVTSERRAFLVLPAHAPKLVSPIADEVVLDPDRRGLTFVWSRTACGAHTLELSTEHDFSSLLLSVSVRGHRYRTKALTEENTYFWRVRSIESECGYRATSRADRFRLAFKPLPAAPETIDAEIQKRAP